jgi:hypothetical protein
LRKSQTLSADGRLVQRRSSAVKVRLDELRGKIGRDEDTNANLTRRMLLMLESVAICGDSVARLPR